MNLFVIALNMPKEVHQKLLPAMRQMTKIYPQLDDRTLCSRSNETGDLLIASMHTSEKACHPRSYVLKQGENIVLFDGLPVCSNNKYPAHNAAALSEHWDQLLEDLEGQYVIVRADFGSSRVELFTDIYGIEQVFYARHNDSWIISNSVLLVDLISGIRSTLDPNGLSMFLNMGWVGSDCTLRSEIRVISPGSYWTWHTGEKEPQAKSYYSRSRLAKLKKRRLTTTAIRQLYDKMIDQLSSLSSHFGGLRAQLTGGMDSRLIAGLLMRGKLLSHFVTYGHVRPVDLQVAAFLAKSFGLEHETLLIEPDEVIQEWNHSWWYLLRQNDGMVGFDEIPFPDTRYLSREVERRRVTLWGPGGGVARGHYYSYFDKPHRSMEDASVALKSKHIPAFNGLLRSEPKDLVAKYLDDFVADCAEDGFDPVDIPDVFYLYERTGRWPGTIAHITMPLGDMFSPFCTRPFVECAFGLPAEIRSKRRLHYRLIHFLEPRLHWVPYDHPGKFTGASLNPLLSRIRNRHNRRKMKNLPKCTPMTHPMGYFEAKREELREMCLDQSDSAIWQFVDKSKFEHLTASATEPDKRKKYLPILFRIATLVSYESWLRSSKSGQLSEP